MNQRTGSSRLIISTGIPGQVTFEYKNWLSAFDRGRMPHEFPGIGLARQQCAVRSFEIARDAGIPTHFRSAASGAIYVQEFALPDIPTLSGAAHGFVVPLEFLYRFYLEGSLWDRVQNRTITPQELGFPGETILTKGMKLPSVWIECSTKFEPVDRILTDREARRLSGLSDEQWGNARGLVLRLAHALDAYCSSVRVRLIDGKCELGLRWDGTLVLVDVFGTPDENRFVDEEDGTIFSKDIVRNELIRLGYKDLLARAKNRFLDDKSKWPPYPRLTDEFVAMFARRYVEFAEERYASR